jgi:hypothetical protein
VGPVLILCLLVYTRIILERVSKNYFIIKATCKLSDHLNVQKVPYTQVKLCSVTV